MVILGEVHSSRLLTEAYFLKNPLGSEKGEVGQRLEKKNLWKMYKTALCWYQAGTAYTQHTESDKALSNFVKTTSLTHT